MHRSIKYVRVYAIRTFIELFWNSGSDADEAGMGGDGFSNRRTSGLRTWTNK